MDFHTCALNAELVILARSGIDAAVKHDLAKNGRVQDGLRSIGALLNYAQASFQEFKLLRAQRNKKVSD